MLMGCAPVVLTFNCCSSHRHTLHWRNFTGIQSCASALKKLCYEYNKWSSACNQMCCEESSVRQSLLKKVAVDTETGHISNW